MALKTSLVITGDTIGAQKAVDDLAGSLDNAAAVANKAKVPIEVVDRAQEDLAASARDAASAEEILSKATDDTAAAANKAKAPIDAIDRAQDGLATSARDAASAEAILGKAANDTAAAATKAKAPLDAVDRAQVGLAASARDAASAEAILGKATNDAAIAATKTKTAIDTVDVAQDNLAAGARNAASAQAILTKASNDNYRSVGQQKAGMFSLGQNLQDVGVQVSMGTDLMRIMAMQGGQLATAVDMIGVKGAGGRLAAFLAGPYGAIVLTATAILGPWIAKLLGGADAEDKATKNGLALVDALSKQKFATDEARKAIRDYNEQQERNRKNGELAVQQSLAAAEADLKSAEATRQKTKAKLEDARADALASNVGGGTVPGSAGMLNNLKVAALEDSLKSQNAAIGELQQARRNLLIQTGTKAGEASADKAKAINLQYDLERQRAERAASSNDRLAASIDKTVAAIERRRKADLDAYQEEQRRENAKPKRTSLGNQIEAGSAAAIYASADRYRGLSENKAGDRAQLKDLFNQANVNVDPQMVAWCAAFVNSVLAANGVKGTGSLSARSFLGFGQSTDTPNKGDIVVSKRGKDPSQGHVGFYQGTDAQGRVLVLGGNTGDRVGTQAINRKDVLGFRQAPSAADSYKETQKAAEDAIQQFQRDLEQVTALYLPATAEAKKYADELARIDTLAKAYDPKNATSGLSPEQAAAARAALKTAHDKRIADLAMTPEIKAADDAKKAIDGVIASLGAETKARATLDPVQRAMAKHQDELAKLTGAERTEREAALQGFYAQAEATRAVEEATRAAAQAQAELRDLALNAFDAIVVGGEKAGDVVRRLAERIASAAIEASLFGTGPLAALLKGGTAAPTAAAASGGAAQATADLVGKSVGKSVGDRLDGVFGKGNGASALKNAGIGYAAANITGGSGLLGSAGGMLGGEAAKKLLTGVLGSAAGPLGSIAGGIIGGVVGNLFKKANYGTASVSSSGGTTNVGIGGNSSSSKSAASGLGDAVSQGVAQIAKQLGGELGSYAVSIGTYKDKFRVSTTGFDGRLGNQGKNNDRLGIVDFGKDGEAAAVAFAIRDALADGAVKGLSERVQKALNSSTDVNAALAEAMKVQDLELTMGGIGAQIDKAFRDFEAQAQERVRLATAYGFDVVAIEKRNGEDRAKLAEQLATQQVGSLKNLIDEMTRGSLFEGTAMERIAALNEAITKAKADLDAGKDGAADTLANLYQQRLAASKEAYGTTSGYAADRTATLDAARAAVAQANARIVAAQNGGTASSDPALAATNAALSAANVTLDEMADQNARMVAALEANNELLTAIARTKDYSSSLLSLAQRVAV